MFFVRLKCPLNRETFAVEIERGLANLPPYAETVPCPSCGLVHPWAEMTVIRPDLPAVR